MQHMWPIIQLECLSNFDCRLAASSCDDGDDHFSPRTSKHAFLAAAEAVAQANAGIKNARAQARTNSGQAGAVTIGQPGSWINRLRIVLPHGFGANETCAFCEARKAATAPGAPTKYHEVLWETLRVVQERDEARQRAFYWQRDYWQL